MKTTLVMLAPLAVMLAAGPARSQERAPVFGDAGHLAISAERLFGYVHATQTATVGELDVSQSADGFSLLSNPLSGVAGTYMAPRIGADVVLGRSFTVGLAAAYFVASRTNTSTSGFSFAPRVGYAATLGSRLALWPRVGVTYLHVSNDPAVGPTTTATAFALTLEAPLAIFVAPRVAILAGPSLDYGLTGSLDTSAAGDERTFTDFSIWAGLLVLL